MMLLSLVVFGPITASKATTSSSPQRAHSVPSEITAAEHTTDATGRALTIRFKRFEHIEDLDSTTSFYPRLDFLRYEAIAPRTPVPNPLGDIQWVDTPIRAIPTPLRASIERSMCNNLLTDATQQCMEYEFIDSGRRTNYQLPLTYIDLPATDAAADAASRVLIVAGTHGDERSSVHVAYQWLKTIQTASSGTTHWRFIPALNLDGLMRNPPTRTNANGIDLNRNLPTKDWEEKATTLWMTHNNAAPRFFPGKRANSEPESQFLIEQINDFDPHFIISIHAPYNLIDYDFPNAAFAPPSIGSLKLKRLGSYPGSLGRYSGLERKIPTATIELADATQAPSKQEMHDMLEDLVYWLDKSAAGEEVAMMPSQRRIMLAQQIERERKLAEARRPKMVTRYKNIDLTRYPVKRKIIKALGQPAIL